MDEVAEFPVIGDEYPTLVKQWRTEYMRVFSLARRLINDDDVVSVFSAGWADTKYGYTVPAEAKALPF